MFKKKKKEEKESYWPLNYNLLYSTFLDFMEVMKCEHERAVHLFVDSLMNKEHLSYAFQCTGPDRFKKGICLSCRKNRCNKIGYNATKMRKRRNSKMYLKTRADTPFAGEIQEEWNVWNVMTCTS